MANCYSIDDIAEDQIHTDKTEEQKRLFCFGPLVMLDVACCYLWFFSLYSNIKIGKNSC